MRKKYMLINMVEAKVVDIGTFDELSKNNRIGVDRIKWSYYQNVMIHGKYLVKEKENENK